MSNDFSTVGMNRTQQPVMPRQVSQPIKIELPKEEKKDNTGKIILGLTALGVAGCVAAGLMKGKKVNVDSLPFSDLTHKGYFADFAWNGDQKKLFQYAQNGFSGKNSSKLGEEFMADKRFYMALLAGPPGTGKSTCIEAIAKSLDAMLLKLDISQMQSKYKGDTLNMLQAYCSKFLQTAAENPNKKFMLYIDEADSIFAKVADQSTNCGQENQQIVNYMKQFLVDLGGLQNVQVMAATNEIGAIDSAIISRFGGKAFWFGLPDAKMFTEALTTTFSKMKEALRPTKQEIEKLAKKLETEQLSYRDVDNICLKLKNEADAEGFVCTRDNINKFLNDAIDEMNQGKNRQELEQYHKLEQQYYQNLCAQVEAQKRFAQNYGHQP